MTPGHRASPPGRRARRGAAAVLAAAFAVLLPVSVTAAWIRGTVLSTDGYVAAVAPIAADPVIHAAVRTAVTGEIDAVVSHAAGTLPRAVSVLAGPLSGGLAGIAGDSTSRFMASPAFQRLWVTANRSAHSQLVSVLNGDSRQVTSTDGKVVINLMPLVNDVLGQVSRLLSVMSGRTITLPAVSGISAAGCQRIAGLAHRQLSADCGQIPLLPASALAGARRGFLVLSTATLLLLILTPLAGAGALLAAPRQRRRRALLQMAIGGALTLLVAGIAVSRLQSSLLTRAEPPYQSAVGVIVHALTNGFFTMDMWLLMGGVVVAAVTLASGPYSWAAVIRTRIRRGIGPRESASR